MEDGGWRMVASLVKWSMKVNETSRAGRRWDNRPRQQW